MKANRLPLTAAEPSSLFPDRTPASLDRPLRLQGLAEAEVSSADAHMRALAEWVRTYLMRPHPDLGRPGHVCPFTSQAAKLDLLRVGVSTLQGGDRTAVVETMQQALRAFDGIACKASTRIFRTVIVGFPNCADTAGIETLRHVQNAMRHHSIVRAKMIGLFEPNSPAEGLLNAKFRPLRSPIPALAIRMLVEQDAPFVMRNPLLVPVYLIKFPLMGGRRLLGCAFTSGKVSSLKFLWRRATGLGRHGS